MTELDLVDQESLNTGRRVEAARRRLSEVHRRAVIDRDLGQFGHHQELAAVDGIVQGMHGEQVDATGVEQSQVLGDVYVLHQQPVAVATVGGGS